MFAREGAGGGGGGGGGGRGGGGGGYLSFECGLLNRRPNHMSAFVLF